ncbi:molybdate ABC transporter substrate-binding protein [Entomomonas asaccharolytica]|uniref:Molybdate ABC transporter substrate-binding protein n=1 Tax=Entomomonas asaccharolytica TaxID=2785331 RepID=A0A974NHM2_9GAMM|nr:molybdate ABC transporter substrate-binding protein [Entomomonas asaccharolytica]QQP86761.1 molybdate ABC transporter substrate-binding protein [Entomomonas asaccharolytica]
MISKNLIKQLMASVIGLSFASIVQAAEIVVSAAASLNNAFKEIATQFEKNYPEDQILFNFAASGTLLQQIAKGAPVDVFASADQETMDQAEKQQLINTESRKDFTKNTLVLISPLVSSLTIKQLTDLNLDTVKRIAVGNPANVPAGRYTQEALEQTGQWQALKDKFIYTQNVRQALDYVARDEVDVGFVYGSDVAIMQDKVKILLTASLNTPITYPIAQIKDSKHNQVANNFIEFVLSTEGQQILAKYGFSSIGN